MSSHTACSEDVTPLSGGMALIKTSCSVRGFKDSQVLLFVFCPSSTTNADTDTRTERLKKSHQPRGRRHVKRDHRAAVVLVTDAVEVREEPITAEL